jgi:hypothetical protein
VFLLTCTVKPEMVALELWPHALRLCLSACSHQSTVPYCLPLIGINRNVSVACSAPQSHFGNPWDHREPARVEATGVLTGSSWKGPNSYKCWVSSDISALKKL